MVQIVRVSYPEINHLTNFFYSRLYFSPVIWIPAAPANLLLKIGATDFISCLFISGDSLGGKVPCPLFLIQQTPVIPIEQGISVFGKNFRYR